MDREKLRVSYRIRSRHAYMGRFGGGWQWALGFEASGGFKTVIVNLLTFSVTFTFDRERIAKWRHNRREQRRS